jgi:hypothetical protein
VDDGSNATVVATPNAGYAFVNWTVAGVPVSAAASYTFAPTADRVLVANFAPTVTFAVSTSAAPGVGGTTNGGGNYESGTNATVTAVPEAGYVFSMWTVGGSQVSTSLSYTFAVTANRSLVANFVVAGLARTITTSSSPTAGGGTHGGGNYLTGTIATVVASPSPGYAFSKWQEGGVTVSTSASYTFNVTSNRTLVAKFNEAFVITATASPAIGGTTEMDSTSYKTGEKAKAQAVPADGYSFANWTENGVVVSDLQDYTFNVTGNRNLVANFTWDAGIVVTTSSAPSIGGTTSGDGPYLVGDNVIVAAVPSEGYGFANWTVNGLVVSSDQTYTFIAAANRQLRANFTPLVHLTATASPAIGGSVDGAGDYIVGENVTITAAAYPGYYFVDWTENGTSVSTQNDYLFTVAGARALVANFSLLPVITLSKDELGSGAVTLAWPTTAIGWILQESGDAVNWQASVRPIVPADGKNTVTVSTTDGQRYFRLALP